MTGSHQESNPDIGLSSHSSATELQLDSHQPSQSYYCTGGLKCISLTPSSHSVCTIRTQLGLDLGWHACTVPNCHVLRQILVVHF